MSLCKDKIVIVTGGGQGIGRSYATMLAQHGATVVVNDVGSTPTGETAPKNSGREVVETIIASGGSAVLDTSDVSDWSAAQAMIESVVARFKRLDVLVNNAGILRDRMLVNMTEDDWDSVVRVHLKGTFAPTRHAAAHWRARTKAGERVQASVINTTSHSALFGNVGQANYAAAKGGVAALTIVAARELGRLGVRVNAVAPRANTRLTEGLRAWTDEERERRNPDWVAALVTWLASDASLGVSGRVFEAWGFGLGVAEGWQHGPSAEATLDPEEVGKRLLAIIGLARPNAGIERDTWFNP